MSRRQFWGVGAAACVACCIGPLLVVVGAVASAGAIGAVTVGVGALVVAAVVIVVLLGVHRRHSLRRGSGAVRVELGPIRR